MDNIKEWLTVNIRPQENQKVKIAHCLTFSLIFGDAVYKNGAYRNSKGGILDTPSYWMPANTK